MLDACALSSFVGEWFDLWGGGRDTEVGTSQTMSGPRDAYYVKLDFGLGLLREPKCRAEGTRASTLESGFNLSSH